MPDLRWEKIKSIFHAASILTGAERDALLDRECGNDADLRREVESLLTARQTNAIGTGAAFFPPLDKARVRVGSDQEHNAANTSTIATPLTETVGTRIGPYKLLQQIGEGGFGVVFMADQESPVRRRVALKIIKLGMDTRRVVARFEAERQALAMMDHPNIARVLDAGATDSGRPYFVMELVKGDPITDYCDKHNLSIPERLELFEQVCHAVQHAHTKGVIHRDIKPSNVLVSTQDGRPHAKVIDFGIAKATDHQLTEKTLFTEHKALIGTPAYMSPEQAEGSLDIDTRTDVYSLGVLLYELLSGSTPFDQAQLRAAAFGEIQRIIREVEPPKPSTRVSSLMHVGQAPIRAATVRERVLVEPQNKPESYESKEDKQSNHNADDLSAAVARPEFANPHPHSHGSVSSSASSPKPAASSLLTLAHHRRLEPATFIRSLRGELDWIVMKSLDKDRARRYETANALAADVRRHLAGEPVVAAPPSTAYRIRKFVKRYKGPMIASSIIVLMLFITSGVSTFFGVVATRANRAEKRATQEAERRAQSERIAKKAAITAQATAEFESYVANLRAADACLLADEIETAKDRLLECTSRFRNWEWGHLNEQARRCLFVLHGHEGDITSAIYSPDGKWIATTSMDKTARLWNAINPVNPIILPHDGKASLATFSADGKKLATACNVDYDAESKFREMWIRRREKEGIFLHPIDGWFHKLTREHISDETYDHRLHELKLTSNINNSWTVSIWNTTNGKKITTLYGFKGKINSVNFSADAKQIVITSNEKIARVFDTVNGNQFHELIGHKGIVNLATFSPDDALILTGSKDTTSRIWDTGTGAIRTVLDKHKGPIISAAFSPDGKRVLTLTNTEILRDGSEVSPRMNGVLSETLTGKILTILAGASGKISFSPSGEYVLIGNTVWDLETGKPRTHIPGQNASFSIDGKRIITYFEMFETTSAASAIFTGLNAQFWNTETGKSDNNVLSEQFINITSEGISPDGNCSLSIDGNTIRIWNTAASYLWSQSVPQLGIAKTQLNKDGTRLLVRSDDGILKLWDTQTAKIVKVIHDREDDVTSAIFSPDGTRLVTTCNNNAALWDALNGEQINKFQGHRGVISSIKFNRKSSCILTKSDYDQTARLWDATTGHQTALLNTSDSQFNCIQFNSTSELVCIPLNNRRMRLLNASSGIEKTIDLNSIPSEKFDNCPELFFNSDGSQFIVLGTLWDVVTGNLITTLDEIQTHSISSFEHPNEWEFSPTGKYVLSRGVAMGSYMPPVINDLVTGKILLSAENSDDEIILSPDGTRILICSPTKGILLYSAESMTKIAILQEYFNSDYPFTSFVRFSEDCSTIVTSSYRGQPRIHNAKTGVESGRLEAKGNLIKDIDISSDGKRIVTIESEEARVWNASTGKFITNLVLNNEPINEARFSQHGERIIELRSTLEPVKFGRQYESDKNIRVWNAVTGKQLDIIPSGDRNIKFSSDGTRLITSSEVSTRLCDATTGKRLALLWKKDDSWLSAAINQDGLQIALASSSDSRVSIYETITNQKIWTLRGHDAGITAVAFSPKNSKISTASRDKTSRIWDVKAHKQLFILEGHTDEVLAIAFSPDGSRIVTGSADKTARIWVTTSGAMIPPLLNHSAAVDYVEFNKDGSRILTHCRDGSARLWDAVGNDSIANLSNLGVRVHSVAFSPDGKSFIAACEDKTARIWDAVSGKQLNLLEGHDGAIDAVSFSTDGTRIVTGSRDRSARVWDATTGKMVHLLSGHASTVTSVTFSPDNTRIATASDDGTVRIWDSQRAKEVMVMRDLGKVRHVSFTPDGRRIIATTDSTLKVWNAGPLEIKHSSQDD